MKKILSNSTLAIVSTAMLVGCSNNQTISEVTVVQEEVKVSSNSGLNDYFKSIAKMSFNNADKNKDGLISLNDYLSLDPSNQITEAEKKLIFKKLDKDSDGMISFLDVEKNLKLFLSIFKSYSKEQLRNQATTMFEQFDINNNSEVSFNEFIEYTMKKMPYMFSGSVGLALSGYTFEASDKNKNDSLSFSEFEDYYYNFSKGTLRAFLEGLPHLGGQIPTPPNYNPPSDVPEPPASVPDYDTPGYNNPY